MKKILLVLFVLAGCDSPRNQRVVTGADGGAGSLSNAQATFKLSQLPLSFRAHWLEGPFGNVQLDNALVVYIYDNNQQLTDLSNEQKLGFFATMPSMGHPLDQAGDFVRLAQGVYLNSTIRFNMPGDWRMELWVMDASDQILDQVVWNEFF